MRLLKDVAATGGEASLQAVFSKVWTKICLRAQAFYLPSAEVYGEAFCLGGEAFSILVIRMPSADDHTCLACVDAKGIAGLLCR